MSCNLDASLTGSILTGIVGGPLLGSNFPTLTIDSTLWNVEELNASLTASLDASLTTTLNAALTASLLASYEPVKYLTAEYCIKIAAT
jgi:hypothetical protein|tara:strand:+ start:1503 stop:1766 length:264 start_codon:yes stop_codon:yes gene_type:complete